MMTFRVGVAAAAFAVVGGSASAATVQQLIHFDELGNNAPSVPTYYTPDNNFALTGDPAVNFSSSSLCAPSTDATPNGNCVHELSNGATWTLEHDATASGDIDYYGDDVFTLLGFYFNLQGEGNDNSFTLTSNKGGSLTWSVGSTLNTDLLYREDGTPISAVDVNNNVGYFVDLRGLVDWEDVLWVNWANAPSGQTRMDCITVEFDGTTSQPVSDFEGVCGLPDATPVPLPAAGWLLIAGLGGLAAYGRKKRAA